jgi:hypothetical protein
MQVATQAGALVQWTPGIPQTPSGDLKMVTAWKTLGFLLNEGTTAAPSFVQVERNDS